MASKEGRWPARFYEFLRFIFWAAPYMVTAATSVWGWMRDLGPWIVPLALMTLCFGIWGTVLLSRHAFEVLPWRRKRVSMQLQQGIFTRPMARKWELKYGHLDQVAVPAHALLDQDGVMRNRKLTNCAIVGPLVIEPEEDWVINNCHWDNSIQFPQMFQAREDPGGYGVARSSGCDFKNCTFDKVLFRMKRSEIQRVIDDKRGDGSDG